MSLRNVCSDGVGIESKMYIRNFIVGWTNSRVDEINSIMSVFVASGVVHSGLPTVLCRRCCDRSDIKS